MVTNDTETAIIKITTKVLEFILINRCQKTNYLTLCHLEHHVH
jgi:hypothetical protein